MVCPPRLVAHSLAGATLGSVISLPQTRPGDEDHGGDRRSEDFNGKVTLKCRLKHSQTSGSLTSES